MVTGICVRLNVSSFNDVGILRDKLAPCVPEISAHLEEESQSGGKIQGKGKQLQAAAGR